MDGETVEYATKHEVTMLTGRVTNLEEVAQTQGALLSELSEIIELLRDIRGSLRIVNRIAKLFAWAAGIGSAIVVLWAKVKIWIE